MRISRRIFFSLAVVVMAASFVVVLPIGEASALIKKSAAKSQCEDTWGGDFKPKKQLCVDISKDNKKDAKSWCENKDVGGSWVKQDDGKFTCSWAGNGFADEDAYDSTDTSETSSSSDDGVAYGTNTDKVYGAGKDPCPNGTQTSILGDNGCYTDDGKGGGVYDILLIILNILTAGVGVLGVLGLILSGVTYLTARDNEQQVAKAKNRILQIVIGLAVYAVLYLGLQFIIPGGIFGN